jgi:hypothetical protein
MIITFLCIWLQSEEKKGKAEFPTLLVNIALTTVVNNQGAHIINPVNQ